MNNNKQYGRVDDNRINRTLARPMTQHVELDGKVYCYSHFNTKYPTLWNYYYVNYPTLADAFAAKFVYWLDNDEVIHCDLCKAQLHVPDSDKYEWTQAWVEVALKIGFEIANNGAFTDETELRHQCYIILGRYHIKASDYKRHVRVLIQLVHEMNRQRLGAK